MRACNQLKPCHGWQLTVCHFVPTPREQEAVDSAEKWKQFAEQLQAKQGELQEALAGAQAELQVGAGEGKR